MNRALDIAVALPILVGGVINGAVALVAAGPAMAVAVCRVERAIRSGR